MIAIGMLVALVAGSAVFSWLAVLIDNAGDAIVAAIDSKRQNA